MEENPPKKTEFWLSIPRQRAQVIEGTWQQLLGLLVKCLKERE